MQDIKHLNHVRMRFWTDTENHLQEENKKRDMYVLQRSTAFSQEQLERWHRAFAKGELRSSGTYTDCTPRAGPAGGVEREAFVDLFATIHPAWGSAAAAPLMEALFRSLDANHDLVRRPCHDPSPLPPCNLVLFLTHTLPLSCKYKSPWFFSCMLAWSVCWQACSLVPWMWLTVVECIKFKDFVLAANTLCNGSMEEKAKCMYLPFA